MIFEDMADLLIGWLVDPTHDYDQYDELCDIVIYWRPFWINTINNSVEYMNSFAKDIVDTTADVKKLFAEDDAGIVRVTIVLKERIF